MSKYSTNSAPSASNNNKSNNKSNNKKTPGAGGNTSHETITITATYIGPNRGGSGSNSDNHGNSSTAHDPRPGYFGDEILALVRGLSPAEILLKMPDIVNLLVKSAEVFDITYKTNLARKVAKLGFIDFHNPYVSDRYLDTATEIIAGQQKLQISALAGRALGISIAVEIAKEIQTNGVDATRIGSTALVAFMDTLAVTAGIAVTAIGTAAALSTFGVPTAIITTIGAIITAGIGVAAAVESLYGGPYSNFKAELINKIDKELSSLEGKAGELINGLKETLSLSLEKIDFIDFSNRVNEEVDLTMQTGRDNQSLIKLGKGSNSVIMTQNEINVVVGGKDKDTVDYGYQRSAISVSLRDSKGAQKRGGRDVLYGIENVKATSYNDILVGSDVGNEISAGSGDDTISTGNGNDIIYGGYGSENITTGDGDDIIYTSHAVPEATQDYLGTTAFTFGGLNITDYNIETDYVDAGPSNDIIIGGRNNYIQGGEGYDTLILSKGTFSDKRAQITDIVNSGIKYRNINFSGSEVFVSRDVEKISIHDAEVLHNKYSVGRWTYDINEDGSLSEKYWTQESSRNNSSPLQVTKSEKSFNDARLVYDFNGDGQINNYAEYHLKIHNDLDSNNDGVIDVNDASFNNLGYLFNKKFLPLSSIGVANVNLMSLAEREKMSSFSGMKQNLTSFSSIPENVTSIATRDITFTVSYHDGATDEFIDADVYSSRISAHEEMIRELKRPNANAPSMKNDQTGWTDPIPDHWKNYVAGNGLLDALPNKINNNKLIDVMSSFDAMASIGKFDKEYIKTELMTGELLSLNNHHRM